MLINEFIAQIEAPLRDSLDFRSKLNLARRAAWTVSLLLAGSALGSGTLSTASIFGVAALGCTLCAAIITFAIKRNSGEIRMRMQSLAAMRGIAREAGASPAEIAATDAVYLSFYKRDTIEIMRGRNSLI